MTKLNKTNTSAVTGKINLADMIYSQNGVMGPCFILNRLLDIARVVICYITLPTPIKSDQKQQKTSNLQNVKGHEIC